ncbi:MAG: histidine kinase [Actinomycetota bacterium]
MVGNALRALWTQPRPERPPVHVWRDWALVGVLLAWALLEALLREDLVWRPVALLVSVVIGLALLWRRTHPLAAVAAAFGVLTVVDVARILAANEHGLLLSVSGALVLPYSLFRWGAGREAGIGLGIILVWLIVTHIADPTDAWAVVAAYGFFLFSAALGAAIRFHAHARLRDIEEAKLRQRTQLARELHDTVGHHLSAIAVQAQAGRTLAASHPDRAMKALETIEEAASRALEEMRAMVGVLRDGAEADLAPQPGVADIEHLARQVDGGPRIDVHLSGDVDGLSPPVGVAIYRIAQESITNAVRHARQASRITVDVVDEGEQVRLTVRDDGDAATTARTSSGHGLAGMAERAELLGGTLRAGPGPGGGWMVEAAFPTGGAEA